MLNYIRQLFLSPRLTKAELIRLQANEVDLTRRVNELQTVAEVSLAAATILDPTRLLSEVV